MLPGISLHMLQSRDLTQHVAARNGGGGGGGGVIQSQKMNRTLGDVSLGWEELENFL